MVQFFADSHVGLIREDNEDSFAYCHNSGSSPAFALVADGVGGHDKGEVASQMTAQIFIKSWRKFIETEEPFTETIAVEFLNKTLREINRKVYELNLELNSSMPMGTTVVLMVFFADKAVVAHVGDSRAYLKRESKIYQLTKDHSCVQEMLNSNLITEDEAIDHPLGHIITRSIGPAEEINIDVMIITPQKGDFFLLCSDGLTNYLINEELNEMLDDNSNPRKIVKKLIQFSLRKGGEDNVTVLGCSYD
jgi:protein phosphatase